MEIKINPMDYVDEQDITSAILSTVKTRVGADLERILSNMAYDSAGSILDSLVGEDNRNTITSKVSEILNQLDYTYHLLRKRNVWEKDDSIAQKIMDEEVLRNKDVIQRKVQTAIESFNYDEYFENELGSLVIRILQKKLEGEK